MRLRSPESDGHGLAPEEKVDECGKRPQQQHDHGLSLSLYRESGSVMFDIIPGKLLKSLLVVENPTISEPAAPMIAGLQGVENFER